MKFSDVDMQEVQSIPASLVHSSSENGTPDHGVKRSRSSDTVTINNGCSSKGPPEVIDLDGEDSPIENEEEPAPKSEVTNAKKVSAPWPQGSNMEATDKKPVQNLIESTTAECPTTRKGNSTVSELPAPAEADEALSNHSTEGERKRPSLTSTDDSDPKRAKLDVGAISTNKLPTANASQSENVGKDSPKPSCRDSSEVSVVDLVEDDDEQEKVKEVKVNDKSPSDGVPVKVDAQASSEGKETSPNACDSPVANLEVKAPLSEKAPVLSTTQEVKRVIKSPSISAPEKRTSLSGKNGVISPVQTTEAKKEKIRSDFEKLVTPKLPRSTNPIAVIPKQSTSATTAAMPVLTPEATEVPVLALSKAMESANEGAKEGEIASFGVDLEKLKGLNAVHSETRKAVQKLRRQELENFFMEMASEWIIYKSDAGRYRQLYEEAKEAIEVKSSKMTQMNKQLADLSSVVHRAINDVKDRRDAAPLKVTRSVGLQLDQIQIVNANRNRIKDDRSFVTPPGANNTAASSSTSSGDRLPYKYGRQYNTQKTTPPSTPNGAITPASKDGPSNPTKSPQRQLKALHPRLSSSVPQAAPTSTPQSNPMQLASEAASKRLGFIDIADDKIVAGGAQIGVRRHQAPSVISSSAPSSSVNTNPGLNAISSSQVISPALKVIPPQFARTSGGTYQTPGANTRVVTAAAIPVASGTPGANSRLAYIIPTSSPLAMQPRQLVLQSAAQSQQMRGRPPGPTLSPTMIVRPNALLQVPPSGINNTPTTLLRAVQPGAPQQVMPAAKNPLPQPGRMCGMPARPLPKHPAPLPAQPQSTVVDANLKPIPRRPVLKLSKVMNGIVLSWNMTTTTPHEEIASYQLYAYQEGANAPPSPSLWKKVGDVKALPLPMACTLTQFADGHTYHFAVRAVDVHGRVGEFSVPGTIELFS